MTARVEAVHVWLADEDRHDCVRVRNAARCVLGREERERAGRLALPRARHRYLLSRLLLRGALSSVRDPAEPADWQIACARGAGPLVRAARSSCAPHASLSRTPGAVAVAVSDHQPVGIDVQRIPQGRTRVPEALLPLLSAPERAWVCAWPPHLRPTAVTRLWTLKEARGKALGVGLLHASASSPFHPAPPGARLALVQPQGSGSLLASVELTSPDGPRTRGANHRERLLPVNVCAAAAVCLSPGQAYRVVLHDGNTVLGDVMSGRGEDAADPP